MPTRWNARSGLFALLALAGAVVLPGQRSYGPARSWWDAGTDELFPREERYENPEGWVGVVSSGGGFNTRDHPFFTALGSNGRACVTCHQPANGMTVTVATLRERWTETGGKDPIFAAVDGSNCPDLPQGERGSHSLLLERGLFRIALPWPSKIQPDFRIEVVRDPTGCNVSPRYGLWSEHPAISVFRRPRMTANLRDFAGGNSLMADGREPSLEAQASTAILVHEKANATPRPDQLAKVVEFERQIFVAQSADIRGGLLTEPDGPSGLGPLNVAFSGPVSLDRWRTAAHEANMGLQREFRASAARGSDVFRRDCASCHTGKAQSAEIGTMNHPLDEAAVDLPLFRITCDDGRVIFTQDPARGLVTGKCADVGAVVAQQMRGLAARAPYFASGSARTLQEVIEFYERRFGQRYSLREKQDLLNYLRVL